MLALTLGAAIACVPPVENPPVTTPVVVTASSGTITYGDAAPTITASYAGLPSGVTAPSTPPTCTTTATPTSPVGTYVTSCSGAADAALSFTYADGSVTVTPAPVEVTASSAAMLFGDAAPTITASYDGLKNGQTAPATPATCSTDATSTSALGDYDSTCSGAADPNYEFSYVDGTVTVGSAVVTVTASSATTTYGDAAPGITATYTGFVGGETAPATPATCTTAADSTSDAGTYASSCSGAADPNYAFDYVDGTVTVTPAAATVTASSDSVTFGFPVPAISASYSGLVNGDTTPDTPATCSTGATSVSPVGDYATTCVGAADANYTFTYVDGVLSITVGVAPVTVTAPSATLTYGDAVPALDASYSGFTGGQTTPASADAVCTTTATSASDVGTYAVDCAGAADPNYAFAYVAGSITIVPAVATVTASSDTFVYGSTVPTVTASYSGLLNGTTAPATAPTCGTDATSTSDVGSYTTSCTGAADPNYTFNSVDGSISVTRAAAVVTASSTTSTYGGSAPAVTASYAGLLNGQTDPATAATCVADVTTASPLGTYATSCSGADDPNYTFTYVDGDVTVGPAPATVTASSDSSVYGASVPAVTPAYGGLVNGDTAPSTPATCDTTATSSSTPGPYVSSCSGAADPNYTFSYVDGVTTITKAPVVATASSATMNAGESVPAITASYTGFLNGETAPATPPTCGSVANGFSPVGTHATTCAGADDPLYTFTYAPGVLTIKPSGFAAYKVGAHSTTVAAASNGLSLPQGTLNVAAGSGAGFSGAGYINLTVQSSNGAQQVFCNALGATNFNTCTGGTGTLSTGGYVTDAAPNVFDVYTISGGKTAVQPSSLTIVDDVPAANRGLPSTVTATANNGLITYYQSASPTGTFSLTYGICSTGTSTYSAGDSNCWTGKIFYSPATGANIGARVTVSIVTSNQYQTINIAGAGRSTVPAGQNLTTYLAPAGSAVPKKQPSSVGDATVNSSSVFTSIYPIPAGFTYVGASLIGGDVRTAGIATVKYCTATGTGCSAKTSGNFYDETTFPYIQVTLPSSTVPGGDINTMPTVALTLQASGAVGTVGNLALSEYVNSTSINAPIIGNQTALFDGYPTTGSNTSVTPPNGTKTTLWATTIN